MDRLRKDWEISGKAKNIAVTQAVEDGRSAIEKESKKEDWVWGNLEAPDTFYSLIKLIFPIITSTLRIR